MATPAPSIEDIRDLLQTIPPELFNEIAAMVLEDQNLKDWKAFPAQLSIDTATRIHYLARLEHCPANIAEPFYQCQSAIVQKCIDTGDYELCFCASDLRLALKKRPTEARKATN